MARRPAGASACANGPRWQRHRRPCPCRSTAAPTAVSPTSPRRRSPTTAAAEPAGHRAVHARERRSAPRRRSERHGHDRHRQRLDRPGDLAAVQHGLRRRRSSTAAATSSGRTTRAVSDERRQPEDVLDRPAQRRLAVPPAARQPRDRPRRASCPTTDQRAASRARRARLRRGAYETNPPQTTTDGPAQPTNAPSITFSSDEANSTFECRVVGEGDLQRLHIAATQPTPRRPARTRSRCARSTPTATSTPTPASVTSRSTPTPPTRRSPSRPTGTVHSTNPDDDADLDVHVPEAGATLECRAGQRRRSHRARPRRRWASIGLGHAHVRGPRGRQLREHRPDAGDAHVHVQALQPALRRLGPARETDTICL